MSLSHLLPVAALLLALVVITAARPTFTPFGGLERLRTHSATFLNEHGVHQDEFFFAHKEDWLLLKCTCALPFGSKFTDSAFPLQQTLQRPLPKASFFT